MTVAAKGLSRKDSWYGAEKAKASTQCNEKLALSPNDLPNFEVFLPDSKNFMIELSGAKIGAWYVAFKLSPHARRLSDAGLGLVRSCA